MGSLQGGRTIIYSNRLAAARNSVETSETSEFMFCLFFFGGRAGLAGMGHGKVHIYDFIFWVGLVGGQVQQ